MAAPANLTAGSGQVATSPAVSIAGSTRWIAWLEYSPATDQTRLRAQRFAGSASAEGPLTVASGRLLSPVVLAHDDGAAWFFWVEVDAGGGHLRARQRKGGSWTQGAPIAVTTTRAAYPAATLDQSGAPWVAWEAHLGTGGAAIQIAHWTGSGFGAPTTLSPTNVPAYAPALETDAQGEIWAAWQSYVGHNYEIVARRRAAGQWGATWQITDPKDGAGNFTGMHVLPTIHRGANGVVWIAWVAKGQDVRAPGTMPHLSSWVRDRRIQLRRVHPDGQRDAIHQVPVPLSSIVDPDVSAERRGPDRPRLLAVRSKIMVFYRALTARDSSARPIHWRAWMQYMNVGTSRWSAPVDLGPGTRSEGFDEPVAVADSGSGFWAAWQQGKRAYKYESAAFAEPESDIFANEIADAALPGATLSGQSPQVYGHPLVSDRPRPQVTLRHLGKTYRLYRGDLHSHSHHSSDATPHDDLIQEDHRRARDLLGLEFYSVNDHGERINRYQWQLNETLCLLNNGAHGLTTLGGLEYTSSGGRGHQNVIYNGCLGALHSAYLEPEPAELWGALPLGQALTIPHHTVEWKLKMTFDFRRFDARFVRLFEVYQARGSFECDDCPGVFRTAWPAAEKWYWTGPADPANGVAHLQDALAMGRRMGVIASPDHTGFWGVAAVYASSASQGDLFAALEARRSYGISNAAARIVVDLRGDGHLMGEAYDLGTPDCPVLYGRVRTDYVHPTTGKAAVIEQLKLYRVTDKAPGEDGQVLLLQPNEAEASFTFHDAGCPRQGSAAYYLRVKQSDVHGIDAARRPTLAWSSPLFVDWQGASTKRRATIDPLSLSTMASGQVQTVAITVHNTGDIAWTGLEHYGLVGESDGPSTPVEVRLAPDEYVLPGQSYTFQTKVGADVGPGSYALKWRMSSPAGSFGEPLETTIEVIAGSDAGLPDGSMSIDRGIVVGPDAGPGADATVSADAVRHEADLASVGQGGSSIEKEDETLAGGCHTGGSLEGTQGAPPLLLWLGVFVALGAHRSRGRVTSIVRERKARDGQRR